MIIDIWINCPSETDADRIAEALMDKRLVACANRYPRIRSRYFWKGEIASEDEVPLLLKTRTSLFEAVVATARASHPYETPSVLCIDVAAANQDYIDWIYAETRVPDEGGAEGS